MKLVGYIRVSSETQADNTSLDDQRRRIASYCDAFQHELVQVFEEVGSGKNAEDRPQFQAALDMVKGEADGIVALRLDRIARNTRDVLALVEDVLQPSNKALVLLDLNVDTSTPTGRMILTVMAAVASLERETINERCRTGKKNKAAKGGYIGGYTSFGTRAINGELETDEKEQETIALIRRHRRSGKSYREIAAYLNAQSIPTKRGGAWIHTSVKAILDRAKLANA
jgi:site-specific DNA recombinase